MPTPDELDDLTDDQWDAELIIEYLTALKAGPVLLDLGPPTSAKADGSLAGQNEAAWPLVLADPRFKALKLPALDARMAVEAGVLRDVTGRPR